MLGAAVAASLTPSFTALKRTFDDQTPKPSCKRLDGSTYVPLLNIVLVGCHATRSHVAAREPKCKAIPVGTGVDAFMPLGLSARGCAGRIWLATRRVSHLVANFLARHDGMTAFGKLHARRRSPLLAVQRQPLTMAPARASRWSQYLRELLVPFCTHGSHCCQGFDSMSGLPVSRSTGIETCS